MAKRCWLGYDEDFDSDQVKDATGCMICVTGDLKTS